MTNVLGKMQYLDIQCVGLLECNESGRLSLLNLSDFACFIRFTQFMAVMQISHI
ncbi:hypothetical protein GMJAKD_04390 [Candidatus Electrothrix aarhusensis]